MHSSLNRLQAVFGFFTTVALFVAGLAALSVLLFPADDVASSVELKGVQVIKGRPHYYSSKREEYAQIRFDLDADFSPLFNWNTKQLFVYVLASYPPSSPPANDNNPRNSEVIIWDAIIPAPESPYSFSSLKERFFPATSSSSSRTKSKTNNKKKQQQQQQKSSSKTQKTDKPGVLHLRNQKPKYQITDISGKIAERENVTLVVGWNVQPWVGALWWSPGTGTIPRTAGQAGRSKAFNFPALKGSNRTEAAT